METFRVALFYCPLVVFDKAWGFINDRGPAIHIICSPGALRKISTFLPPPILSHVYYKNVCSTTKLSGAIIFPRPSLLYGHYTGYDPVISASSKQ